MEVVSMGHPSVTVCDNADANRHASGVAHTPPAGSTTLCTRRVPARRHTRQVRRTARRRGRP
jgi:hypothetical protein